MPHDEKKPYIPLTEERYQRSGFPYGSGNVTPGYIPESNVPVVSPERRQAVLEAAERERLQREFMARQAADPMWSRFDPSTDAAFDRGGLSAEDWAVAKKRVELDERRKAEAARSFMGSDDPLGPRWGYQGSEQQPWGVRLSGELLRPPLDDVEIPPQGLLPEVGYSVDAASPLGPADFRPDLGILGEAPPPEGWEEHLRMKNRTASDVYREALSGTEPPLEESRGFLAFLDKNKELLGALAGLGMTFRGGPWAGSGVVEGMQNIRKGVVEDRAFKAAEDERRRAEAKRVAELFATERTHSLAVKKLKADNAHRIKEFKQKTRFNEFQMKLMSAKELREASEEAMGDVTQMIAHDTSLGNPEPSIEEFRKKYPDMKTFSDIDLQAAISSGARLGIDQAVKQATDHLSLIKIQAETFMDGGPILESVKRIVGPDGIASMKRMAMKLRKDKEVVRLQAIVSIMKDAMVKLPSGNILTPMFNTEQFVANLPEDLRGIFGSLQGVFTQGQPTKFHDIALIVAPPEAQQEERKLRLGNAVKEFSATGEIPERFKGLLPEGTTPKQYGDRIIASYMSMYADEDQATMEKYADWIASTIQPYPPVEEMKNPKAIFENWIEPLKVWARQRNPEFFERYFSVNPLEDFRSEIVELEKLRPGGVMGRIFKDLKREDYLLLKEITKHPAIMNKLQTFEDQNKFRPDPPPGAQRIISQVRGIRGTMTDETKRILSGEAGSMTLQQRQDEYNAIVNEGKYDPETLAEVRSILLGASAD